MSNGLERVRRRIIGYTRDAFYDLSDLRERGWTPGMIGRLLGAEDGWYPTTHYLKKSKKIFERGRVEAVESTEEFRAVFEMSLSRRSLPSEVVTAVRSRSLLLQRQGAVEEWHALLDGTSVLP